MLPQQLMAWLSAQVDALQAKFPPNRLALLLTPLLAIGAAAASPWVAQHFPGLPGFSTGQLTAFGVTAAAGLVALAYKFIDGAQKNEANVTLAADNAAHRDHVEHLTAMQLESEERQAAIKLANSPEHALDLLGLPPRYADSPPPPSDPVGSVLPPPPPIAAPPSPDPAPSPPAPAESVHGGVSDQLLEAPAPAVPPNP